MSMRTSLAGTALLEDLEGEKLTAYKCSADVWTIGYGTTVYPDGRKVQQGDKITLSQARSYLQNDLRKFEAQVDRLVQVPLTQNQFDALVSFTYNVGGGALEKSTLLKKLNAGDYGGAAKQFMRWNKVRNKKTGKLEFNQGLHNRRKREMELFSDESIKEPFMPKFDYQKPDPNNTPLRNRDLPLPTAYQEHGIDSVEERKNNPAVVTAGAGGVIAGGVGITEVVQHVPAIASFAENANPYIVGAVIVIAVIAGVVYFVRRWRK